MEKKFFSLILFQKILIFSYMTFFRKCSIFRRSIPLIYLHFCLDLLCSVGKRLYKKAEMIFKIYDVRHKMEHKKITMNILPDISNIKSNQTMNFSLLTEYNVRNVFSNIMQKTRQGH